MKHIVLILAILSFYTSTFAQTSDLRTFTASLRKFETAHNLRLQQIAARKPLGDPKTGAYAESIHSLEIRKATESYEERRDYDVAFRRDYLPKALKLNPTIPKISTEDDPKALSKLADYLDKRAK